MTDTITAETITVSSDEEDEEKRVVLHLRAPAVSPEPIRDHRARVAALRASGMINSAADAVVLLTEEGEIQRITNIEDSVLIENEAMFGGDVYEYTVTVNKI